jgi:hypothetical protein
MNKTEVRAYIKRCREGLRWAEESLRDGDLASFNEAMVEASGSLGEIMSATQYSDEGIRGMK